MADRKPFLLRLDPATFVAMQRWADAELRSLNAQIEYVLRKSLREAGRLQSGPSAATTAGPTGEGGKDEAATREAE